MGAGHEAEAGGSQGVMFEVRDARPEELEEISATILSAFEQYGQAVREGQDGTEEAASLLQIWEAYRDDAGNVRARFGDSELIVAEHEGSIVGAVTFRAVGTGAHDDAWPEGCASFRLLAVLPEARGLGIGKALVRECLARARRRGATAVGLHTLDFMQVALAMYERMGFVRVPELDYRVHPQVLVKAYRLRLPT